MPHSGHHPISQVAVSMKVQYNHDLNVSEEFLASYPAIRDVLEDRRLWRTFQTFDAIAQSNKRSFQILGFWSLGLGSFPLLTAAARMMMGEPAFAGMNWIGLLADFYGILAIALVLWIRLKRHRALWCQAVFCRERLRQWHFQIFLDGRLMDLLSSDRQQFNFEVDRRWSKLQQELLDGYGMTTQFVNFASREDDFFHQPSAYTDTALAGTVLDALWTLRFEHQLRFSRRKIEKDGEGPGLALAERTSLSESLAVATLAGAIFVSTLAFILPLAHSLFSSIPFESVGTERFLAGLSLFLAVLSATTRAYRAGYTVPDESESYEEYCDRIRDLKAAFRSVETDQAKFRQLEHIEEEAIAELRRFLRMKMRATFIF